MRRLGALAAVLALLGALILAACGGSPQPQVWAKPAHTHFLTACASSDCGPNAIALYWSNLNFPNTTGYYMTVNGTQVGSATSAPYTFYGMDCGTTFTLGVRAHDGSGDLSQVYTTPYTTPACPSGGAAPVNTAEPYFAASTVDGSDNCTAGCAIQGQQLSVTPGAWSNSPTSFSYQWQDCTTTSAQPPTTASCANATGTGATTNTYTVGASDVGKALVPIVTAANSNGATSTSVSGSCNQGLVPTGGIGSHAEFNYTAGCSPISAVAGTSSSTEKFCTNSFATCGFGDPFAGSAGVPLGVTPSTTGACATWTHGGTVSTAGTTINGCEITGVLNVNANNVTIENSDVDYSNDTSAAINVGASNTGFLLEHSAVHGTSASNPLSFAVSSTGSDGTALNLEAVYVYNIDRIITTAGIVQDSVCLGNGNFDAVGEHMECTYVGKGSTTYVLHSVLISSPDEDGAAAFYAQGDFGVLSNIEVENNLFADGSGPGPSYGGYCIDGGDTSGGGSGVSSGETITGNRMSRIFTTSCGGYGVYAFIPSFAIRTGNIWDDTLAAANSG